MAGLAADRQTSIRAGGSSRMNKGYIGAGKVIYFGAQIAVNATGFVVPASDAAAIRVIGIAQASVDNSAGADGAATVNYLTGIDAVLDNAGGAIVQANMHGLCYAADDHSVTNSAGSVNKVVSGVVVAFTAATVTVHIDEVIGLTA